MIKYTTKDIVNRAKQLADLNNSDFISWNENINLLNENWQKIYQQLIDNGDKTFIKEFETVSLNKIKLPCDFYQLFSVELIPSCRQILRKAKSESESSLTYDIENDYLILYGTVSEKIRIKYIPIPQTLTLQNETKDIDSDFSSVYSSVLENEELKFMDCYKNKYLFLKKTKGTNICNLYIFNKDTNEIKKITNDFSYEITYAVIGYKNIVYFTSYNKSAKTYSIYSIKNGYVTVELGGTPKSPSLLKRDKDVGAVYIENKRMNIFVNDNIPLFPQIDSLDVVLSEGIGTYMSFTNDYISFLLPITNEKSENKWIQLDIDLTTIPYVAIKTTPFEGLDFGYSHTYKRYSNVINGKVCISTKDMFYVDGYGLFNNDEYEVIGVNELNNDEGYGISIVDTYNTNHVLLHSHFVDTLLLYPNNIYFNFMAMLLAISYKIKQNADITVLSTKYGEMEAQYFDSLSRDVNNVVRITNVY